jgi:hypothetical protein
MHGLKALNKVAMIELQILYKRGNETYRYFNDDQSPMYGGISPLIEQFLITLHKPLKKLVFGFIQCIHIVKSHVHKYWEYHSRQKKKIKYKTQHCDFKPGSQIQLVFTACKDQIKKNKPKKIFM